ncbi:hypothetical protein AC249_AIPGENE1931 [Exaiptasia diaphana]|nr:hypothetical protein AC249_AIPGENE1931 [Exaiptasia diaphana]
MHGVFYLLVGVSQRIGATISVGPGTIEEGSKLEITSKAQLKFHLVSGNAYGSSNLELNPEKNQRPYKVTFPSFHEGEDPTSSVAIVTLPKCGPYEKLEFDLIVEAGLNKQSEQMEEVEHNMTFCCKWLQPATVSEVVCSFKRPLTARHVLHCSNDQRFVQVIISGKSSLHVNEPALTLIDCPAVKAVPVNPVTSFDMSHLPKACFMVPSAILDGICAFASKRDDG